jgi:CheY-like chemotaxis protein
MSGPSYILVVDDNHDIRELVREILEFEGYVVVTASNGKEALERLGGVDLPSLILLDLMMPTMNGWEFRAEQLKDLRLASIPLVVLTGDGNASEKARVLRATSYIMKPVHLDSLLVIVQGAVNGG